MQHWKTALLSNIINMNRIVLDLTKTLIEMFLLRSCSVDALTNTQVLIATIKYILTTNRSDEC